MNLIPILIFVKSVISIFHSRIYAQELFGSNRC